MEESVMNTAKHRASASCGKPTDIHSRNIRHINAAMRIQKKRLKNEISEEVYKSEFMNLIQKMKEEIKQYD